MQIDGEQLQVVRTSGYETFGSADGFRNVELNVADYATLVWMVEHKQPVLYADVREHTSWKVKSGVEWIKSYIGAPIFLDNQVIGFINADSATPGAFTEQIAHQLQIFANQAAWGIRNARLYVQIKTHAEKLETVVSERTQVLEQERRQLQAILNAMTEGVAFTTIHEMQYVNRALVELTGYDLEEWRSRPLDLYINRSDNSETKQEQAAGFLRSMLERGYWREEVRITRKRWFGLRRCRHIYPSG
jgi:GAF domain-containing protein